MYTIRDYDDITSLFDIDEKTEVRYNIFIVNIYKKIYHVVLCVVCAVVFLFSMESAYAGTLTNFSYTSESAVRATTTNYIFSYTIETADPNMVFYASFPFGFDVSGASADVTIDGVPATVGEFSSVSNLVYVRLTPATVASGADVVVTINGVINPLVPDEYNFDFIRTAESSGTELDTPTSMSSITIIGETGEPFSGDGEGTRVSPYEITSCGQLQEMDNNPHAHYVLSQDIDCTESATWNINLEEFEDGDSDNPLIPDSYASTTGSDTNVINNGYFGFLPIGDADIPFTGSLDGAGHTISNIWIFRKTESNIGLFGKTLSAEISNLSLTNSNIVGQYSTGGIVGSMDGGEASDITLSNNMVRAYLSYQGGGFAGEITDGATVDNVTNTGGTVHGSGSVIGGIVGYLEDATITDSHSSAAVDGGDYIGGFVGSVSGGTITDSYATGNVRSDRLEYPFIKSGNYSGGFAGYINSGTISDSYATGNVESTGNYAGGFSGSINSSSELNHVYATGNVTGLQETKNGVTYNYPQSVGGFVGQIFGSFVEYAYATGDVVNGGSSNGGFSGLSGCGSQISFSYATGDVTGGEFTGGFTGDDGCEGPGTTFTKVFATGNATGTQHVGGFAGRLNISTLTDGYASGNVTGNSIVGGFAGELYYTDLDNAYSRGQVFTDGDELIGSFVGLNFNDGEAIEGFWDNTVAASFLGCGNGVGVDCDGVEGKSTELMTTQATFEDAGYDFSDVWVMNEHNDRYPYFLFSDAPVIETVSPEYDDRDVAIDRQIVIEFSQAMNTDSVMISAGPCVEDGCPSFSESWNNADTILTLTKSDGPFAYNTEYTITIASARSRGNIPLLGSYEWFFTTVANPSAGSSRQSGSSGNRRRSVTAPASVVPTTVTAPTTALVRDLTLTNTGDDVKKLQALLIAVNSGPKALALARIGATGYFGTFTRDALAEYQAKNGIVPAIGYFGKITRAQMKSAAIAGIWW